MTVTPTSSERHTNMTPQELFNTICSAIIKQGKPSIDPTFTQYSPDGTARSVLCRYRAPDGSKCAAGHVIPDDRYNPRMENKPIWLVQNALPDDISNNSYLYNIVHVLQVAHDDAARESLYLHEPKDFITQFKLYATQIADDLNLDTAVVS